MSEGIAAAPAASAGAPAQQVTPSGQGAGEGITAAKTTPTSAPQEEYFDVPVNGKTVKMTKQQLFNYASKSSAADERFKEAAKIRQQQENFKAKAQKDFIEALQDPELGLTKEQIRARFEDWYMKEVIEAEGMSEEQKKAKETEARLRKYEEKEKEDEAKKVREEQEKLTMAQREALGRQIMEAMDSSGLPKTEFFASRMAFYMRQNLMNGYEAPISMIVDQVKAEYRKINSGVSENSTVEQLIEMFGEGVVNKIRQYDLKQLREKRNFKPPVNNPYRPALAPGQEKNKLSSSDVDQRLRDMRAGKLSWE